MPTCRVCNRDYVYDAEQGYDRELCGPVCDGIEAGRRSAFPKELNDDLRAILGRPCFACCRPAQALRMGGHVINTKAEDEQAAVLHWLLCIYFEHGEKWFDVAESELRRMATATAPPE